MRFKAFTYLLLPVLAITSLVLPITANARKSRPLIVEVMRHGVRLTLTLPHRTYPRNALVRTTMTVSNESSRSLSLVPSTSCPWLDVSTEVMTAHGQMVYPPSVPLLEPCLPTLGGGGGRNVNALPHLAPGSSHTWHFLVILRGRFVRGSFYSLHTPPISVHFVRGQLPIVARCVSTACVRLSPRPAWLHHGPVYVSSVTDCGARKPYLAWHRARSRSLHPACSFPNRWHFAAGYLNHPVTEIDWKQE